MIYLLIAAGLFLGFALIMSYLLRDRSGDGYLGEGMITVFSFIIGIALLVVTALWWLTKHLVLV